MFPCTFACFFTCRVFLTTPTFSVCAHVTAIAAHKGLLCNDLAAGVHTNLITLTVGNAQRPPQQWRIIACRKICRPFLRKKHNF